MKKLLVYMKGYEKECILGPLFKLLEASFDLLVPLVMAQIIDVGIAGMNGSYVLKMGGVLLLLAAVGLTCAITAQYFSAKAAVGFATRIRHAVFAHIQQLSYSDLDNYGTDSLITRLTSDINQVQSGTNLTLRLFLRSPFIVFGAMVMAFTINVKAALIFVVTIPLLSVVVFGVMLISIPLFKQVQQALDGVLGTTRENLSGNRVIRAFNKEEDEIRDFDFKSEVLLSLQLKVGRFSAAMSPATYIIVNIATLILIWSGAIHVDNGVITQGEVIALVNYMSQILVELVKLADLIIQINKAVACGGRIEAVLEIQPAQQNGTVTEGRADAPAVEYDDVTLTYPGAGAPSLQHIHLKVQPGETIGIIGGTGSGKSSLINLIPRFYDVTEGTVRVDGVDVNDYDMKALRKKIGIVQQKAQLFKGTIRTNLCFGTEEVPSDESLFEALTLSQAREFVDKRADGLEDSVEQNGRNLSGGQRQRLTIARALVTHPEILILDDAASALDYATDAKLRQALKTLTPQTTVLIVSQRASSIMHADQILVLDDGEQVGLGTHEELLQTCPVYQEIYASQFPEQKEAG